MKHTAHILTVCLLRPNLTCSNSAKKLDQVNENGMNAVAAVVVALL